MIAPQVPGVQGSFFSTNPLLSPRNMFTDGVLDAMSLDSARNTLIPRLNLEALSMQASYHPSQFAVPLTPSSAVPSSGRLSRLQTPASSMPSTTRMSASGGAASPGSAPRVKSAMSAPDSSLLHSDLLLTNPSPTTSARGKRRRSIYEEDSDIEFDDEDDFVVDYVPTISSARQKKKRALAANSGAQSSR